MPFIEWAMDHIVRIYEWNKRVDEMRISAITDVVEREALSIMSDRTEVYHIRRWYSFNNGARNYYEERNEYTTARLAGDSLEAVDAIVDQFVVAIGEIRKCALSNEYHKIDFWEEKANEAYEYLLVELKWYTGYTGDRGLREKRENALTAVIDALFTRFGDDAYIDENGKFIKSKGYTKPDLSFLLK